MYLSCTGKSTQPNKGDTFSSGDNILTHHVFKSMACTRQLASSLAFMKHTLAPSSCPQYSTTNQPTPNRFSVIVHACNKQTHNHIPSFTLLPEGWERSVISFHFPVPCPLPNLLTCTDLMSSTNGPSIRLNRSSFARYSAIGSGCCVAESMLRVVLRRGLVREKPIRNPCLKPVQM